MAVLSRPPPGHVRAAGEAIAIVDLDDEVARAAPRARYSGGRVPAVTGIAAAGVVALAVIAFAQASPERAIPTVVTASPLPQPAAPTTHPTATIAVIPDLGFIFARQPTLGLPPGVSGVRLSAIPDSLLNDQPAARFRVRVLVRGTTGLGASDGPAVIAWSEDGFWYELASTRLTIPQLIDLASALR